MARLAAPTDDNPSDMRLKIGQVFVVVGELISVGSRLFELETDNATMEFSSPVTGKVVRVDIQSGDAFSKGELEDKIEQLIEIEEKH